MVGAHGERGEVGCWVSLLNIDRLHLCVPFHVEQLKLWGCGAPIRVPFRISCRAINLHEVQAVVCNNAHVS
eukprot:1128503-Amphidinium_carterae.2